MKFIEHMSDIHSFVVLKDVFESWINEGVINEKSDELLLGYTSLIPYPSIYLTNEAVEQEISAAKVCHEILIKYAKDKIKKGMDSDDEKTVLATYMLFMPPEKYMLTLCKEFYLLHYLLKGLYSNYTEEQLAEVNGDDYAKVWLNIFSKGYHFEPTEENYDDNIYHFNETLIMISKMHLSLEYKEKMDADKIGSQLDDYYHINGGAGCMSSVMLFIIATITFAYII